MENASKALLIVGGILIGVLLLSLLVYLFHVMGAFSSSVDQNIEMKNLAEFNQQFEVYQTKIMTAQDVISIGNLARNYNVTNEGSDDKLAIKIILSGVESKFQQVHKLTQEQTYQFMEQYSVEKQNVRFKCTKIEYNTQSKKVQKVLVEIV